MIDRIILTYTKFGVTNIRTPGNAIDAVNVKEREPQHDLHERVHVLFRAHDPATNRAAGLLSRA